MAPAITVVGLGPAGADLVPERTRQLLVGSAPCFLRTRRHPAAADYPSVPSMDGHYESAVSFPDVYQAIVEELVAAAQAAGFDGVVYAVPGSPLVAEDTVALLRADPRVEVTIHPALSFLDLAWARLGVDPLDAGVTLVDGARFAATAAGRPGPFLVAQCWSPGVLSDVKLAPADGAPETATVLYHLGLPDERVEEVAWDDLDQVVEPDHLTSLWLPELAAPVAAELMALDELVRTLREQCPWDREQTHASLARHLLEESYEVLDALDALGRARGDDVETAVDHLEEELGDLLFQIFFHARLAAEEGRFTVADVAAGVHDKLVARHPHVFGDVVAETAGDVEAGWEVAKLAEKSRKSVTDGIPNALPALTLAGELLRKAPAAGVPARSLSEVRAALEASLDVLGSAAARPANASEEAESAAGSLLLGAAELARVAGVDPELALRAAATRLRRRIVATERAAGGPSAAGAPRS